MTNDEQIAWDRVHKMTDEQLIAAVAGPVGWFTSVQKKWIVFEILVYLPLLLALWWGSSNPTYIRIVGSMFAGLVIINGVLWKNCIESIGVVSNRWMTIQKDTFDLYHNAEKDNHRMAVRLAEQDADDWWKHRDEMDEESDEQDT